MREPENGKRTYEQIEIPGELQETMNRAVRSVDKKKSAARYRKRRMMRAVRNIGVAAAAVLLCMTVGVNTNEVLAKELGQLPVIGSLVRVLTITSYHEEDGDHDITVNVPEIEVGRRPELPVQARPQTEEASGEPRLRVKKARKRPVCRMRILKRR